MKTWQELFDDCGNSGEAGKRDDDESHLLAEKGEESLLQRSLPQVKPHSLMITLSLSSSLQFEVDLPADWVVGGDAALPTSLEDKQNFLGINRVEEERTGHMGEPKVEQ